MYLLLLFYYVYLIFFFLNFVPKTGVSLRTICSWFLMCFDFNKIIYNFPDNPDAFQEFGMESVTALEDYFFPLHFSQWNG